MSVGKGKVSKLAGKFSRNTCDCVKKCVAAMRDVDASIGGLKNVDDEQLALIHMHENCGKQCSQVVGDALLEDVLAASGERPRGLTEEPAVFDGIATSLLGRAGLQRKKRPSDTDLPKGEKAKETRRRARLTELELKMALTSQEQARAQQAGNIMDELMNRLRAGEDLDQAKLSDEQQIIWTQMKEQVGLRSFARGAYRGVRPAVAQPIATLQPIAGAVAGAARPAARAAPRAAKPTPRPTPPPTPAPPQPPSPALIKAKVEQIDKVFMPAGSAPLGAGASADPQLAVAAHVDSVTDASGYGHSFADELPPGEHRDHINALIARYVDQKQFTAARDLDILPFGWADILDRRGVIEP